jgi:hypothetical protein
MGAAAACLFGCVAIIMLMGVAFHISAIVIGHRHQDKDVCNGDPMDYADWLLIGGAVNLPVDVFLTCSLITTLSSALADSAVGAICGGFLFVLLTVLGSLFRAAWAIIGIVILAKSNFSECKDEQQDLAVMTAIYTAVLCLTLLQMVMNICGRSKASSS